MYVIQGWHKNDLKSNLRKQFHILCQLVLFVEKKHNWRFSTVQIFFRWSENIVFKYLNWSFWKGVHPSKCPIHLDIRLINHVFVPLFFNFFVFSKNIDFSQQKGSDALIVFSLSYGNFWKFVIKYMGLLWTKFTKQSNHI